jgi:hypothetical protein
MELFALLAKRTHRMKNDRSLSEMMLISAQPAVSQTLFWQNETNTWERALAMMEKQAVRNGSMSWAGMPHDGFHHGEMPRHRLCPPHKDTSRYFLAKRTHQR